MLAQQLYNANMAHPFSHTDKVNALAGVELFAGLPHADVERVAAQWTAKTISAGTILFSAQQPGDGAYVIVRGTIKLHIEQWDGSDVFIDIAGAGDVLGEMSIVENMTRSATAQALEETRVLKIDRAGFEELLRAQPRVAQNLMRILSARLRAANERIQALSRLDVKQRVARQLLLFAIKYGQTRADGAVLIQIRLTQANLADLVGATRERVNQVLGEMRRARWIEMDGSGYITLCARDQLNAIVGA